MKKELIKWLHAIGAAILLSGSEALVNAQSTGHFAARAFAFAVGVRVVGYAITKWGPQT